MEWVYLYEEVDLNVDMGGTDIIGHWKQRLKCSSCKPRIAEQKLGRGKEGVCPEV